MIAPPKLNKVLSTAHLTLITLSSLFALIIFVTSLFTHTILLLGLNTASAAVTLLFHTVIIILAWRRSLNSQPSSPVSLKSPGSSTFSSTTLPLPATGSSLTVTIFLLPLWIIALASQIFDFLDPNSPNKTQANQSIQLATPQGRVLGTDTDEQGFGNMLSSALIVCECVEVIIIFGMVVYGISSRRKWRVEKEKATMKNFMLNPWVPDRDLEKQLSPDKGSPGHSPPQASAPSPIESIKSMTKRFTLKSILGPSNPPKDTSGKRDPRIAPFPVRGPGKDSQAQPTHVIVPPLPAPNSFHHPSYFPPPSSSAPSPSLLSTSYPHIEPSFTSSRASQISHGSRFSRLTSNLSIKPFKRPGRPWSYLTPGRPSMQFGETPIETPYERTGKAHPFKGQAHEGGYDDGADSVYDLYIHDEKEEPQPLGDVSLIMLPNSTHRQPTMSPPTYQSQEMFGGVVKVKTPRPPMKAYAQADRAF